MFLGSGRLRAHRAAGLESQEPGLYGRGDRRRLPGRTYPVSAALMTPAITFEPTIGTSELDPEPLMSMPKETVSSGRLRKHEGSGESANERRSGRPRCEQRPHSSLRSRASFL